MNSESHPNSRIVTIFRTGSFLSRAQGPEVAQHFADAKVSVGAYYESKTSRKVASGLSFTEEDLLLPRIIDTPTNDREYRKKITEFYNEIDTKVPEGTGVRLQIGLAKDNSMPLADDNLPLEAMDYIRYRHAKNHPFMGANKKMAEGNALMQYYIFDPETLQSASKTKTKERDIAMQIYLQIKGDINKVDMMLTLLGTDPREFSGKNKEDDKIEALRVKADTDSKNFSEIYEGANLQERYWLEAMSATDVLKVMGGKYYVAETNELIGNSMEEAIFWFKDEDNSNTVVMLKGILQENLKKAPEKKKKVTKALAGKALRQ